MAILSSTNFYTNAIVGTMTVGSDINVYELNSSPKFALGVGFTRGDGNKYRYCEFGANTQPGYLVATDLSEGSTSLTTASVTAPVVTYQQPDEVNGIYPGSKGSHYVLLAINAIGANTYAGGYLAVVDDTGEGYTYRIKCHDATSAYLSGSILIKLYEPLQLALDATSDVFLMSSPFGNLEAATSTTDVGVVGATVSAPSAGQYAWVCARGITSVLADAAPGSVGDEIQSSTSVPGAYTAMVLAVNTATSLASGTVPSLGYIVCAGASTGQGVVYLTIE